MQRNLFLLTCLAITTLLGAVQAQIVTTNKANQNLLGVDRFDLGSNVAGGAAASVGFVAAPVLLKSVIPPEWQAQHPSMMSGLELVAMIVGGLGGYQAGSKVWRKLSPSPDLMKQIKAGNIDKVATSFHTAKTSGNLHTTTTPKAAAAGDGTKSAAAADGKADADSIKSKAAAGTAAETAADSTTSKAATAAGTAADVADAAGSSAAPKAAESSAAAGKTAASAATAGGRLSQSLNKIATVASGWASNAKGILQRIA